MSDTDLTHYHLDGIVIYNHPACRDVVRVNPDGTVEYDPADPLLDKALNECWAPADAAGTLTVTVGDHPLHTVIIDREGTVAFSQFYQPDDTARRFWDLLAAARPVG